MYDPGALYVDPILTNFSVGFDDQTLYGRVIFPEMPVRTQSAKYNVFDRSNWIIFDDRREPGTVANEVRGRKWSYDTFDTKEHSLQAPIWDEERQELVSQGGLADPVFGGALQIDPEQDATELVTGSIMRRHELGAATLARDTTQYPVGNTVTLSGTSQWDNYTYGTAGIAQTVVSDPVANIMAGMRAIWSATRRYPNVLAIPAMGLPYIENHPRIIDRFKNWSLTVPNAFQALTGFQGQIVVLDDVYNAANNIEAAQNIQEFWGKDVWLGISDPNPGLLTRTFGKTFAQVYPNGTVRPTDRWREEPRRADIVRTSYKYDYKVVTPAAGYLIKNAFSVGAW